MALLWAAERGHDAVVKLLLEKGNYGWRALLSVAKRMINTVVMVLLEKKIAELLLAMSMVNSKDKFGQTALSLAAENGHDMFLQHGIATSGSWVISPKINRENMHQKTIMSVIRVYY